MTMILKYNTKTAFLKQCHCLHRITRLTVKHLLFVTSFTLPPAFKGGHFFSKLTYVKQPPTLNGQYFVTPNVHCNTELNCIKQAPASKFIFTLCIDWLLQTDLTVLLDQVSSFVQ